MKKVLAVFAAVALLGLGATAFAHGWGGYGHMGYGYGHMGYYGGDEATFELRAEIEKKQFEHQDALRKGDAETVKKLEKELDGLYGKIETRYPGRYALGSYCPGPGW